MNDSIRGVVSTPPKSEMIVLISVIAAHDLVVAEPLAPLDRPAEEGDRSGQPRVADLGGTDQVAGAPQRLAVLVIEPELERRPALYAVGSVLGREQGLGDVDGGAVGRAEHRPYRLLAMAARALWPHRTERKQAAVGKDDADGSAYDLVGRAHRRQIGRASW